MSEHTGKWAPAAPARLSELELTGRARTHVAGVAALGCELHPLAGSALLLLRAAAARDGIDAQPVSGFRSFERQLEIWNGKFEGRRALLDADGRPLDVARLDEPARVAAILAWSALPGASRHHWGSECDLIDRAALAAGAPVELLGADYLPGGRYARLSAWLDAHAWNFGFFRPYERDRGGVRPEPWHLSFAPVAAPALAAFTIGLLREALAQARLAGAQTVAAMLPELFERYVATVAAAPRAALAARALSPAARPA